MARQSRSLTTLPTRAPAVPRTANRTPRARQYNSDANGHELSDQSLESFLGIAASLEEQQRQLVRLSTQALIVLEGERARLARQLDSDVAQRLSDALAQLRRIERMATQVSLRKDLATLGAMLSSVLGQVAHIGNLLAPPIIETPLPATRVRLKGPVVTPPHMDADEHGVIQQHAPRNGRSSDAVPARDDQKSFRVLLAEGHAVVRAGLRQLLSAEPDIDVVGEASDGRDAAAVVSELHPNVVVIDLTTPAVNGVEAVRDIASLPEPPAILALTIHDDQHYLHHLLEAGASGYVLKNSAETDLITGIRAVAVGGVFLSASAARSLLCGQDDHQRDGTGYGTDHLSDREREVLRLTAEGYTNQEIGAKLYLSPKTVDTYRARITGKLDLHHRSELVRYALRQGLLAP